MAGLDQQWQAKQQAEPGFYDDLQMLLHGCFLKIPVMNQKTAFYRSSVPRWFYRHTSGYPLRKRSSARKPPPPPTDNTPHPSRRNSPPAHCLAPAGAGKIFAVAPGIGDVVVVMSSWSIWRLVGGCAQPVNATRRTTITNGNKKCRLYSRLSLLPAGPQLCISAFASEKAWRSMAFPSKFLMFVLARVRLTGALRKVKSSSRGRMEHVANVCCPTSSE